MTAQITRNSNLNPPEVSKRPAGLSRTAILLGILAIILLTIIPLLLFPDSEFRGSDGAGSETVARIAPEYDAEWITNWWAPPGGETESMLFALQATIGGILIGYFFGYLRGRRSLGNESASALDIGNSRNDIEPN